MKCFVYLDANSAEITSYFIGLNPMENLSAYLLGFICPLADYT